MCAHDRDRKSKHTKPDGTGEAAAIATYSREEGLLIERVPATEPKPPKTGGDDEKT